MIEQQETWEKAHRKLKREVRRAHSALDSSRDERKLARRSRKALRRLARRESIAFDHYTEAEQEKAESFAIYVLED